jgi:hypothetical protein
MVLGAVCVSETRENSSGAKTSSPTTIDYYSLRGLSDTLGLGYQVAVLTSVQKQQDSLSPITGPRQRGILLLRGI